MLLAFSLTVLLSGLNPDDIRVALNPNLKRSDKQLDRPTDLKLGLASTETPVAPSPDSMPVAGKTPSKHSSAALDRSASPYYPSLTELPTEPEFTAPTVGARVPLKVASITSEPSEATTERAVSDEHSSLKGNSQKDRPATDEHALGTFEFSEVSVKNDGRRVSTLPEEIAELRGDLLQTRLDEARRELNLLKEFTEIEEAKRFQAEIDQVRQAIQELRQHHLAVSRELIIFDDGTESGPQHSPAGDVAPSPEGSSQQTTPVIEVTDGSTPEHFNFTFANVDIRRALEVVCFHTRRKVVIDSEIEGEFSGEFLDADPHQAFASLIHAQGFGLTAKGDYIHVHKTRMK